MNTLYHTQSWGRVVSKPNVVFLYIVSHSDKNQDIGAEFSWDTVQVTISIGFSIIVVDWSDGCSIQPDNAIHHNIQQDSQRIFFIKIIIIN